METFPILATNHQSGTCRNPPGPASDMPECPYQDAETEPKLPDPTHFARSRQNILLGVEAGAVYHMSHEAGCGRYALWSAR